jgi:two-component system, OmpR family, phosphate regulon sensor histidine kinase PhoR
MKKTLPLITVLITLSLLGIIFFQILWLDSAKEARNKQLDEDIAKSINEVAITLMEEKPSILGLNKKNDLLFPSDKLQFQYLKPSVIQRFTKEEIYEIVRKAFDRNNLKNYQFEFAIITNSITGEQMLSDNFYKLYVDSANGKNLRHTIPLEAESGTAYENLTGEELLSIIVPHKGAMILKEMFWFIIGAILFTIIITTAFFITVRTLLRQKKVSEIKNDFINNMTHEFKTPLATISLAVDALKNEKVINDKEKTSYFTGIIKEENKRMNKQVETILQAALLDKQEVQLNLKKLSAHELINAALNNITLQIEEKGGKLEINKAAEKDLIMADEVHFTNLINNLLDNAVKYSNQNPVVKLSTQNTGKQIRIKIEDNGIGMNKETLNRIFEKFYRAHTGNVHNVKGFGLGLSYVKTMVDAHKGTIKAESTPGKGSSFIVTIPLAF